MHRALITTFFANHSPSDPFYPRTHLFIYYGTHFTFLLMLIPLYTHSLLLTITSYTGEQYRDLSVPGSESGAAYS